MHLTVLTRKATVSNAICHVALLTFVRFVRYVRSEISVRERITFKTKAYGKNVLFYFRKPGNEYNDINCVFQGSLNSRALRSRRRCNIERKIQ